MADGGGELFDTDHVITALRAACLRSGNSKKWAEDKGLSYRAVRSALYEGAAPGDDIDEKLGYERKTVYLKLGRQRG